ncbi:uncharacterized protein LOC21406409 [Morus notabilis]|nr:uncharacterized protein LOC21406409 [Morus notabilis]
MACSTLDDGFKATDSAFASENGKPWTLSRSPQSTLCALGSGCGCESRGSPNEAHSRVPSPPPPRPSAATWDLLNAAAGEVAKMRLMSQNNNNNNEEEEEYYKLFRSGGLLNAPRKTPLANPSAEFFLNHAISQKQLQFQQLRQQQMMKQQQQSSAIWGNNTPATLAAERQQQLVQQLRQNYQTGVQNKARNHQNARSLGLSPSAWPPLQQQQRRENVSGMRAVFLGNPSRKKECTGTGVFLPRQIGTQHESRRKPACSTVLVPARVVQALNLNLDDMCGAQPQIQPRFNGSFTPDTDVALRLRSNNVVSHQKRNLARSQPQVNHEIRLPQDWTY